jgi:hypothetical protein
MPVPDIVPPVPAILSAIKNNRRTYQDRLRSLTRATDESIHMPSRLPQDLRSSPMIMRQVITLILELIGEEASGFMLQIRFQNLQIQIDVEQLLRLSNDLARLTR